MTFNASYKGIGEMLCADWMVAAMVERAEKAKVFAESIAPTYKGKGGDTHRGRYKRSFEVVYGIRLKPTRRAYARLQNTAPEAFYVEYGTRNNPAHHVLAKAMDLFRG